MIPLSPTLRFREAQPDELPMLVDLLNGALAKALYSEPLAMDSLQAQVLGDTLPGVYPVRWQRHQRLGAWRAGNLVGFLDGLLQMPHLGAERQEIARLCRQHGWTA